LADGRQRIRHLHADAVRRLDAVDRLAAPARPERVGRIPAIGLFGEVDFEIAVIELTGLDRTLLAFGDLEVAGFQFDHAARLAPLPVAAIGAVPVIFPVDADEAPVDRGSLHRAGTIHRHDIEAGGFAFLRRAILERRLHPDVAGFRPIGDADVVTHGAAARL